MDAVIVHVIPSSSAESGGAGAWNETDVMRVVGLPRRWGEYSRTAGCGVDVRVSLVVGTHAWEGEEISGRSGHSDDVVDRRNVLEGVLAVRIGCSAREHGAVGVEQVYLYALDARLGCVLGSVGIGVEPDAVAQVDRFALEESGVYGDVGDCVG